MVELLLKNGADKDVEDCNGVRPWDLALKWGCPDGFEVLRIESVHLGSVAEPKIGCQKIVTSNNMELIRNQFFCSEKSSALDMLLSEWKKAEAQKKKTKSINSIKEALKASRDAEEETKVESQRKSMQHSLSFVEGHRDGVSAASSSSASPSLTSTVHTVNNFIVDKGTRRVSFSAHPNGNFGSQALPSQFLHSDGSKEKDKADDVWGCTELESPLRGEEMRTITGRVERNGGNGVEIKIKVTCRSMEGVLVSRKR